MRAVLMPVEGVDREALAEAGRFLAARLGAEPRRLPALPLPGDALDPGRGQHDATAILRAALDACPAAAARLVVLAEQDLFVPMLTFVFGQAQLGGRAALVSLARLRQEFYGLPPRPALTAARLRKELQHELGHTFGLTHCTDPRCAMALSIHVGAVDAKGEELCRDCGLRFADELDSLRRGSGAIEE